MNEILQEAVSVAGRIVTSGNYEYQKYYSINDLQFILNEINISAIKVKATKKVKYYDIPISFDIETSSFHSNGNKQACMYIWACSISGLTIIGRTWEEFIQLVDDLAEAFKTDTNLRLAIYVHNLSYEFQFMRKYFEWEKVFSIDNRKPIYALTESGIEFKCSYILSNYSLEKVGENLTKYKVKKLKGDLDYDLIRTTKTPLSKKEMQYLINDVLVVDAYIQEQIEMYGSISAIPLTNTGRVRNYCRNECLYGGQDKIHKYKNKYFKDLMKKLTLTEYEYKLINDAFCGGFTHASPLHSMQTLSNVKSYDFTSSYPYVLLSEKFPMSRPIKVEPKSEREFEDYLEHYCCVFDIEFKNINSAVDFEHYISSSKCFHSNGIVAENGRVVSALSLRITITEQDFFIIRKFYDWDSYEIANMIIMKKEYLPKPIILAILDFYEKKTKLKDVEGKEVEYMVSKNMINSIYGMMVTAIVRELIIYMNDTWDKGEPDITDTIEKYNNSAQRFLYYPWGVWVTAYARMNLFTGIYEFKNDYVYSDTDSIKVLNYEKHLDYIQGYNEMVVRKLKRAAAYYGIDFNRYCPKTQKGAPKLLGIWDDEGIYKKFKTLGAKRYMTLKEKDGIDKLSITVSGLNKKYAVPYIEKTFKDPFESFTNKLYIPAEYTGKLTHTYIDDEIEGEVTDYLGITAKYHELSCTHLEKADYDMSITDQYIKFILDIQEKYE